jgi:hypothetical protein
MDSPFGRLNKPGIACALRRAVPCCMGYERNQGAIMNNLGKVLIKMGLLSLLSVMPLAAQMDNNGVEFTASFPFYAGDVQLPAGNYKVVQLDQDLDVLQIENKDTLHSVLVDFTPTESGLPHRNSAVTFEKYGDSDYLDRVWIEGEEYGISVDPGRVETAAEANATQHVTAASGQ